MAEQEAKYEAEKGRFEQQQEEILAEKLAERGALENTAILEAPAGSPASVQFATAAAALAVAEGFRNEGGDSLVVLDLQAAHQATGGLVVLDLKAVLRE